MKMLNEKDIQNAIIFIDAGARTISANKQLEESANILATAVNLCKQLNELNETEEE